MSRGGSYGGGHSSLGYLFSSDYPPSQPPAPKSPYTPPYGIDTEPDEKRPNRNLPASPKQNVATNNYHRAQGQNTGNFITVSQFLSRYHKKYININLDPYFVDCLDIFAY